MEYSTDKDRERRKKFIKPIHERVAKQRALERRKHMDGAIKRKYPNTMKGKKPYINPNYKEKKEDYSNPRIAHKTFEHGEDWHD